MTNLKIKIHNGTPEDVEKMHNTFQATDGVTIKAGQHSSYLDKDGNLKIVFIEFYQGEYNDYN